MATSAARGVTVRALVQQCLSARLQVKPASREDVDDATYVEAWAFNYYSALLANVYSVCDYISV